MICDKNWLQKVVYDQFAVEVHLVPELAADPVGIHLIGFSLDSYIKWFDVSIVTKRSDNWKYGNRRIIIGII
jgi:hypothetical protein